MGGGDDAVRLCLPLGGCTGFSKCTARVVPYSTAKHEYESVFALRSRKT